ncbi:sensor histidine kinase [Aestuariimicrobium soli]|uniref:sensor histidine kinase n=1 Tax=Aestuariimicrobium soli TaxID=2035834 RepID=UPI003EBA10A5
MSLPPTPAADGLAQRARTRGWRWLLDAAAGFGIGWLLVGGWIVTHQGWQPDGRGPAGRHPRLDEHALAPDGWVRGSSVLVGVAVLASHLAPRTAWVVGLAGVALYLANGGAPVAAVIAVVVLGKGLLSLPQPTRQWPWLLGLVPAYGAVLLADDAGATALFQVPTMMVWTVLPLLAVAAVRARGRQRRRDRQLELDRVARAERLRLARDIHDVVGHSLSLISLQSGVALRVLDTDPSQARRSLEAIRETSKQALTEVRTTLGVFREDTPDEPPLAPTPGLVQVRRLVEQAASSGVDVTLTSEVDPATVPASIQAVAHRVVQEGVTNALRHAPGASVRVELVTTGDALLVRVADTGRPVAPVVEGNGLTGMRERVEAVGGRLSLGLGKTGPSGSGFVVEATLPIGGRDA